MGRRRGWSRSAWSRERRAASGRRPRLPPGIDADFVVHEFFVLHAYRGSPAAERAARQGFDRQRGRWEVVTYPAHAQGIAFRRRVAFRFDNGG
jgi:aminoglycoside 6'-N-acetyltransferase I